MNWADAWRHNVGLPPATPDWLTAVIALLCIFVLVVLPGGTLMAYIDRKLSADFQARIGPNRAGPIGIFQPVADFLKLLQKEHAAKKRLSQSICLVVQAMALFSTIATLPIGSSTKLLDTDMSSFLPFWGILIFSLSGMLMGLMQESVPAWIGGVRQASQAIVGLLPALIAMICPGIRAGGFSWRAIEQVQGFSPFHWTVFSNPPFQFVALLVFFASGLVILSIAPLDGTYSPPDIQGGVSSLLHGRSLSLFHLSRFYSFFLWSVMTTVLFLGGSNVPRFLVQSLSESESWRSLQFLELLVLLSKTFGLMVISVWIARANPRPRTDQITDFSWKVLCPLSLMALAGTALWAGWAVLR